MISPSPLDRLAGPGTRRKAWFPDVAVPTTFRGQVIRSFWLQPKRSETEKTA
jgi:hypothetical protein